jgi:FkbM family methyltransferase
VKIILKLKEQIINSFPQLFVLYNLYIRHKIFIKKPYYSDGGEDKFIINQFKKKSGFYVDVGCHHPLRINNCHLLYLNSWRGINIDINKISIELFNYVRKNDVNLHNAVSLKEKDIKFFYDKPLSPYNSLVKTKNLKFTKTVKSQKLTKLIDRTKFKNKKIDFLSVDVEGKDLEVLKSLNFKIYQPKYICVEIWGKEKNKKFNLKKNLTYKFLVNKKYKLVFNKKENYIFKSS